MIKSMALTTMFKWRILNNEYELKQNKFAYTDEHRLVFNLLIVGSILCCTMFTLRVHFTGHFYYAFLLWNLFLAWLPYLLSKKLYSPTPRIMHVVYFALWLLFFPNAPYIITDLVHLPHKNNMWYWYDQSMLVMFALNGLMLGVISLLTVHKYMNMYLRRRYTWPLIFALIFLCAYGIYLGRIERYNSWDIIITPLPLSKSIWYDFRHPLHNTDTFIFTFVVAALLTIFYLFMVSLKYPEMILKKN